MPGATLPELIQKLKAELGVAPASQASDERYGVLLNNMQELLASENDFPELHQEWELSYSAGQRQLPLPSSLNTARPWKVYARHGGIWLELEAGLELEHFNILSENERADPPMRWRRVGSNVEIWPTPGAPGTLRLIGQKHPSTITSTVPSDLDALLLVFWAAAEEAQRLKQADAPAKLLKARERLLKVLSARPAGEPINLADRRHRQPKKLIVIA